MKILIIMENEVQRSLGRIEGGVTEIKSELSLLRTDHANLRGEFNKLESGRLTRLEGEFNAFVAVSQAKSRYTAVWVSAIISTSVAVLSAFVVHFFHL